MLIKVSHTIERKLFLLPAHYRRCELTRDKDTSWIEYTIVVDRSRIVIRALLVATNCGEYLCGQQQAMVPIPEHASFIEEYGISVQAIHQAFKCGMVRLPNAEAVQLRKLDSERCEDTCSCRCSQESVKGIRAAALGCLKIRLISTVTGAGEARAHWPAGDDGKGGGPLTLEIVRQVIDAADQKDARRARSVDGDVPSEVGGWG
jgi:hypothetical protein